MTAIALFSSVRLRLSVQKYLSPQYETGAEAVAVSTLAATHI